MEREAKDLKNQNDHNIELISHLKTEVSFNE